MVCWMLLAVPLGEAAGEERTWKTQDGKFQVVAELIGTEGDVVLLRRADGKTARVPLQRLSETDRTFVAAQAKSAPATASSANADSSGYQYIALSNIEQDFDLEGQSLIHPRVPRELVRQALLIAAREELGLGTRDQTIREPLTISASDKLLMLQIATAVGDNGELAFGWIGRWQVLFGDLPQRTYNLSEPVYVAELRALMVDLAVQLYYKDNAELPNRLADLTPRYLATLPVDPFAGEPFAYFRREDGYMIQSVDVPHHNGSIQKRQVRIERFMKALDMVE
jgi:hypothetical protein